MQPPLYPEMTVQEYLLFVAELKGTRKKAERAAAVEKSAARAGGAVRSIAATLCDLSGVTAVRLSVIGESGLTYYDISEPITPQPAWFSE